jgi:acyl carrier protein
VAGLQEHDEKKLTDIFRDLFNNPDLILTDELTAAHVPGWDSFNHVNLVMAVEEEFNARFSTSEIAQLTNVGQFKELIASKIYSA